MKEQKDLEAYLTKMDKALASISVSDRADIITEIKSHVMTSQERHPEQSMHALLSSLGEPEAVANRFLLERGLKPGKAPKSPMVKWLTIGFLGTVAMLVFLVIVICWSFTPLIHIDGAKGEFELLGGLISINDDDDGDGHISFGGDIIGERSIDMATLKSVEIKFSNGKFEVRHTDQPKISWDCNIKGEEFNVSVDEKTGVALMDMSAADGVKCALVLPERPYKIEGQNGKVAIIEPKADVAVEMVNGKVSFREAPGTSYNYTLDLNRGSKSRFVSSNAPNAVKVQIKLVNGVIHQD